MLLSCLCLCACGSNGSSSTGSSSSSSDSEEAESTVETLHSSDDSYENKTEKELDLLILEDDELAELEMANRYDYGTASSGQDFEKAAYYYELAAAHGNADALRCLGYIYLNGCLGEVDLELAESYFAAAIELDDIDSYIGLALCVLEVHSEELDEAVFEEKEEEQSDALNDSEEAAESDSDSDESLESDLEDLEEERQTYSQLAYEYINLVYEKSHAVGIYYMAYCFENGIGVKTDYDQALVLYEEVAAISASSLSIYYQYLVYAAKTHLGVCHVEGLICEQDYYEALDLFEECAKNGYAMAQYYAGQMYENGYGCTQDYEKAYNYYLMAANQDYAPAINQIGYLYYKGNGVEASLDNAIYYFKLAALQGYSAAQINLAYLYENGIGVSQNYEAALTYYEMAAQSDAEGVAEAIARVESLINGKK